MVPWYVSAIVVPYCGCLPSVPWDPTRVASVGGPRGEEFVQLAQRLNGSRTAPVHVGHRQFYRADYAVHKTATWSAHVRMFSTRSINTECIAHENKQGRHMGEGVTLTYVRVRRACACLWYSVDLSAVEW